MCQMFRPIALTLQSSDWNPTIVMMRVVWRFFREIYNALKPGGRLVYTEYVGDPATDFRAMHRLPIEVGRRWALEAGFEIVEDSDILRTSADDHSLPIFSPGTG